MTARRHHHRRHDPRRGDAYDRYFALPHTGGRPRRDGLPPEVRRIIATVLLISAAVLTWLSLINLAGVAGTATNTALGLGFGSTRLLLPPLLLVLAVLVARSGARPVSGLRYAMVGVFAAGLSGLVHLLAVPGAEDALAAAQRGEGGGYVGWAIAAPLASTFGTLTGSVITLAVLAIAGAVAFRLSPARLAALAQAVGAAVGFIRHGLMRRRVQKLQAGTDEKIAAHSAVPVVEDEVDEDTAPEFSRRPVGVVLADASDAEPAAAEPHTLTVLSHRRRQPKVELPLDLLNSKAGKPTSGDIKANQYLIAQTLKNFGIAVELGEVNVGPTVTQYTLKPAEGVRLSKLISLSDNLALALAAHPIRIEAPIPGRSLCGIEVPNTSAAIVPLRDVLDSDEFRNRTSNTMVALGKDVKGKPWLADLARMPHLLIAGATGSGKSVCINTMIMSLLYQNGPDDLKFVMVDPKRVELPIYNGIPHLVTPVITDVKKTVNALRSCIDEMEKRFTLLASVHQRDIASYNAHTQDRLPYLVVVIDELADLMAAAGPMVEAGIIRLAQMSRAVGIHLIIATQRPSVDVITGLIKANITSRVAFSVASLVDSRTILDQSGAEKLLGRGDLLFVSPDLSKPQRLQGAYASDTEIKRTIDYLKARSTPDYLEDFATAGSAANSDAAMASGDDEDDPNVQEAIDVIERFGKASATLFQRQLKVGYPRAARLLDLLEERGIIGPGSGAKPREILIKHAGGGRLEADQPALDTADGESGPTLAGEEVEDNDRGVAT